MFANSQQDPLSTVEDISNWTRDQLQSYLDKYGIDYNVQKDSDLVSTVKSYRDAVADTAGMFGDKVDSVVSGLKIKLDEQKGMTQNNVNALVSELQHTLRQLELRGELSRDRVQQALDRLHKKAVHQKLVTETQWRDIYNEVSSPFGEQTWYQRVFQARPTDMDASTSLNRWLDSVSERLVETKDMTQDQAATVVDQLRTSVAQSDLSKLGDAHWRKKFQHRLEKQARISHEQSQDIIDAIQNDINAYKIFAMDYAGAAADHTRQWADWAMDTCHNTYNTYLAPYVDTYLRPYLPAAWQTQKDDTLSALRAAAESMSNDWAASSASVESRVTNAAQHWRDSFGQFWRERQQDYYRQLGYSEAQIDWMQTYLGKAFTDQKALTQANIDQTLQNVRHYLQDAQVQSNAQIQHQMDQLKLQLERWKNKLQHYQ
ncbi:hypothetical protein BCR43DRAFT_504889 [Syncephalastrum racemosum]|uniref:Mug135-like C-terminal domain-containing protein n=1 Tax=Syncephalastrum racemosum TaxID=13706 RepID=A0A1X2HGI0_SYNRA|nr:hypothetical protein BCR43DRAFT_504889 [Syncephalastrum racemosum]